MELLPLLALGALLIGAIAVVLYVTRSRPGQGLDQPPSGWEYVFLSVVLSAIGGAVLWAEDAPDWLGFVLLWLGSIIGMAGVVAIGVAVGLERADWRRRNPR